MKLSLNSLDWKISSQRRRSKKNISPLENRNPEKFEKSEEKFIQPSPLCCFVCKTYTNRDVHKEATKDKFL